MADKSMAPNSPPAAPQAIPNISASNVPFFTPRQSPPSGTAKSPQSTGQPIPKLFTPLNLRSLTLQNRLLLSPLCQYSAADGHLTPWHIAHLGGIASRGPGLTFIEATAVLPHGRITPEDSGLWQDSQIAPIRNIVEFVHSQGQKIAIQLAHAGRKASTVAPWLSTGDTATAEVGGWPDDVLAPSAIAYSPKFPSPRAMTLRDIADVKAAFVAAAKRALEAGIDVIEVHAAHGYLLHEFYSPASNRRTDQYGGSWANRTRLVLEVVEAVRAVMPDSMPLFCRVSASDWLEDAEVRGEFPNSTWKIDDTVRLAPLLMGRGVDVLDVSSAGLHPAQKIKMGPGYQAHFARAVKEVVGDGMAVTAVGTITSGTQAEELLQAGLDAVFVGRMFQKNPGFVWVAAEDLGTEIHVASQISWGFGGRAGGRARGAPSDPRAVMGKDKL